MRIFDSSNIFFDELFCAGTRPNDFSRTKGTKIAWQQKQNDELQTKRRLINNRKQKQRILEPRNLFLDSVEL